MLNFYRFRIKSGMTMNNDWSETRLPDGQVATVRITETRNDDKC